MFRRFFLVSAIIILAALVFLPTSVLKRLDDDEIVGSKVIIKAETGRFIPFGDRYWGKENDYFLAPSAGAAVDRGPRKYTVIGVYQMVYYGLESLDNRNLNLYLLHSDAPEERDKRLFLLPTTMEYYCNRNLNQLLDVEGSATEYVCDGTFRYQKSE